MNHRWTCSLCALVALLAGLSFARAASADSLVYTKGADVWIAAPDGSGERAGHARRQRCAAVPVAVAG